MWRHSMCPNGLALHHPVVPILLNYAANGCPTNTGCPWTKDKMSAANNKCYHLLALDKDTMAEGEVKDNVTKDQAKVVL